MCHAVPRIRSHHVSIPVGSSENRSPTVLRRYGEMEGRQLAVELADIQLPGRSRQHVSEAGSRGDHVIGGDAADVEAAVSALAASTAPAMAAVQAAAARAWDITGRHGMPTCVACPPPLYVHLCCRLLVHVHYVSSCIA